MNATSWAELLLRPGATTARPRVLQFNATAYSVNENAGTATITVTRCHRLLQPALGT